MSYVELAMAEGGSAELRNESTGENVTTIYYHEHPLVQVVLGVLYASVFLTALFGNSLVIYVVLSNRTMQTVTNVFITNLAISDILVNITSLWVTPLYIYLCRWVWGAVMCRAVPLFQGASTFISTLTLTAIAVDRHLVIVYPFQARMSLSICLTIILTIWLSSFLLATPLAMHMDLTYHPQQDVYICQENWLTVPDMRALYGGVVMVLQFVVPFSVIAFCYLRIWNHIVYRRSMVATARSDERRKRRLLKMLVSMVVVFALCWLPINALNLARDAAQFGTNAYFVVVFLFAHVCSMSATCTNPILYAWMNDNFRREFQAVLPFFSRNERLRRTLSVSRRGGSNGDLTETKSAQVLSITVDCRLDLRRFRHSSEKLDQDNGFRHDTQHQQRLLLQPELSKRYQRRRRRATPTASTDVCNNNNSQHFGEQPSDNGRPPSVNAADVSF